jgi:hypothetical protein
MATRDVMDRKPEPTPKPSRLRRIGVWTGIVLVAVMSLTVFALAACKTSGGRGNW